MNHKLFKVKPLIWSLGVAGILAVSGTASAASTATGAIRCVSEVPSTLKVIPNAFVTMKARCTNTSSLGMKHWAFAFSNSISRDITLGTITDTSASVVVGGVLPAGATFTVTAPFVTPTVPGNYSIAIDKLYDGVHYATADFTTTVVVEDATAPQAYTGLPDPSGLDIAVAGDAQDTILQLTGDMLVGVQGGTATTLLPRDVRAFASGTPATGSTAYPAMAFEGPTTLVLYPDVSDFTSVPTRTDLSMIDQTIPWSETDILYRRLIYDAALSQFKIAAAYYQTALGSYWYKEYVRDNTNIFGFWNLVHTARLPLGIGRENIGPVHFFADGKAYAVFNNYLGSAGAVWSYSPDTGIWASAYAPATKQVIDLVSYSRLISDVSTEGSLVLERDVAETSATLRSLLWLAKAGGTPTVLKADFSAEAQILRAIDASIYIGDRDRIYESKDYGVTWIKLPTISEDATLRVIAANPSAAGILYATTAHNGTWSLDEAHGATTWTAVSTGTYNDVESVAETSDGLSYILTRNGDVFGQTTAGVTGAFARIPVVDATTGLPVRIEQIVADGSTVFLKSSNCFFPNEFAKGCPLNQWIYGTRIYKYDPTTTTVTKITGYGDGTPVWKIFGSLKGFGFIDESRKFWTSADEGTTWAWNEDVVLGSKDASASMSLDGSAFGAFGPDGLYRAYGYDLELKKYRLVDVIKLGDANAVDDPLISPKVSNVEVLADGSSRFRIAYGDPNNPTYVKLTTLYYSQNSLGHWKQIHRTDALLAARDGKAIRGYEFDKNGVINWFTKEHVYKSPDGLSPQPVATADASTQSSWNGIVMTPKICYILSDGSLLAMKEC